MGRLSLLSSVLDKSDFVYIIGVAGDSGSGKTTFASAIRNILGDDIVAIISLDDYHLYDRNERKARGITPLSPLANDLDRLERDVERLKQGLPIEKMVYDHSTGTIMGPYPFSPGKIVILEGLHAFYGENLRRLCDFKIFVDPDPDVKKEWKLKRDTASRGYSEREVREELAQRTADFSAYIAPQRQYATAVIGISFSRFGRNLGWEEDVYRVSLDLSAWDCYSFGAELSLDFGYLFSIYRRPFSLTFLPGTSGEKQSGTLEVDGFLPSDCAGSLVRFLEKSTGRDPLGNVEESQVLTPTHLAHLFVCGCIVAHRLSLAGGKGM